jgi:hypothetical protein
MLPSSFPGAGRRPKRPVPQAETRTMTNDSLHTMGQQHGRRSWAEPWKIKMVEPLTVTERPAREAALREAG